MSLVLASDHLLFQNISVHSTSNFAANSNAAVSPKISDAFEN